MTKSMVLILQNLSCCLISTLFQEMFRRRWMNFAKYGLFGGIYGGLTETLEKRAFVALGSYRADIGRWNTSVLLKTIKHNIELASHGNEKADVDLQMMKNEIFRRAKMDIVHFKKDVFDA